MNRRTFLLRGSVAIAVGSVGYAIGVEPHWLEGVRRDLPVAKLPAALEGATLAQLSDLHAGPRVSDDYLVHSFDRVRALAPDIVDVTGDFHTHRADLGEAQFTQLRTVLARLPRGCLATVGFLGNHDYGRAWSEPAVALRVADTERALAARRSPAAIALSHNPDALDVLWWGDYVGWVLAGHTHGGQCRPPFLPPPLLPVRNRRYIAGVVAVDKNRTLYISRGVGHLIRARFNVCPEITLFTLRRGLA